LRRGNRDQDLAWDDRRSKPCQDRLADSHASPPRPDACCVLVKAAAAGEAIHGGDARSRAAAALVPFCSCCRWVLGSPACFFLTPPKRTATYASKCARRRRRPTRAPLHKGVASCTSRQVHAIVAAVAKAHLLRRPDCKCDLVMIGRSTCERNRSRLRSRDEANQRLWGRW
jgi:hypothetical protein